MINNPMIVKRGGQGHLYTDIESLTSGVESDSGAIPVILSELKQNKVAIIATNGSRALVAWESRGNVWSYQYYNSNGVVFASVSISPNDSVFAWPVNPNGIYEHRVEWDLYQLVAE